MTTKSYSDLSNIVDTKTDQLSGWMQFGSFDAGVITTTIIQGCEIDGSPIGNSVPSSGSFTSVDVDGSLLLSQDDVVENLVLNGNFRINQRVFAGGTLNVGETGYDLWTSAQNGTTLNPHVDGGVVLNGRIAQFVSCSSINGKYTLDVDYENGTVQTWIESLSGASLPFTVNVTDRQWIKITIESTDGAHIKQVMFGKGHQNIVWEHPTNEDMLLRARSYYIKGSTPAGNGVVAYPVDDGVCATTIQLPSYMVKIPLVNTWGESVSFPSDSNIVLSAGVPVDNEASETMFTVTMTLSGAPTYSGYANLEWEADATQTTVLSYKGMTTNEEGEVVLEI